MEFDEKMILVELKETGIQLCLLHLIASIHLILRLSLFMAFNDIALENRPLQYYGRIQNAKWKAS